MSTAILAMFGLPGGTEWIVIGVVALLIFGRRLPDVARSVGKSIVEFKKGLRDVKDDIDVQSRLEPPSNSTVERPSEPANNSASVSEPSQNSTPASK